MTTIPGGIRTESRRNPVHAAADSALSQNSQPEQPRNPLPLGTEPQSPGPAKAPAISHHARVSQIDPWDALARVLSLLRPDWQPERIRGALLDDRRSPRDVAAAAVAAALDPDVRHPGAIAHRSTGRATPTPPSRRDATCTTHPGELAANCRGCRADHLARPEEKS